MKSDSMKSVCVLRFDKEEGIYKVFKPSNEEFVFNQLPHMGEKLVFEIDEIAHIAEVIDVHYNIKDGGIDVIIGKEREYSDYKSDLDRSGTLDANKGKISLSFI